MMLLYAHRSARHAAGRLDLTAGTQGQDPVSGRWLQGVESTS